MSKIRKSAWGKQCTIRLPEVCNFNEETTILAHVGRKRGMGFKSNDVMGIYCCSDCHNAIDQRNNSRFTKDQLRSYILDALEETLLIHIEEGRIEIK